MGGVSFARAEDVSDDIANAIERVIGSLPSKRRLILESWYHDQPIWLAMEDSRSWLPQRAAQVAVVRDRDHLMIELSVEVRRISDGDLILPRETEPVRLGLEQLDALRRVLQQMWESAEPSQSNVRIPLSHEEFNDLVEERSAAALAGPYEPDSIARVIAVVLVSPSGQSIFDHDSLDVPVAIESRRIDPADFNIRLQSDANSVQVQLELDAPIRRRADLSGLKLDGALAWEFVERMTTRARASEARTLETVVHYQLRQLFWIALEDGPPEAFDILDFAGIGRIAVAAKWVIRWNQAEGRWYYGRA
jgi:hypothetical protein